ncbi:hypothetical protein F7725_008597 [Dissostichus mawsoni]|uniref:Uncharacterized protein n=1 Tax=Dissostichus mawsoni TaxID=36200 RepID=A0A7J5Y7L9_DISMA|nr:hypothetical protein F7725_008597 [Dissostichus mawsoni]
MQSTVLVWPSRVLSRRPLLASLTLMVLSLKVTTVPFARPAYSVFHRLWRQRTRSERGNCCSNSRVVAADGLVTGPGVEAVVEARSCRDQQAAHLRAVEGSDGAVSGAGVQQPVVDLHRVHSFLMALERTFSGQIILTVVRGRI